MSRDVRDVVTGRPIALAVVIAATGILIVGVLRYGRPLFQAIFLPTCSGVGAPYTADELSRALAAADVPHEMDARSSECGSLAEPDTRVGNSEITSTSEVFPAVSLEPDSREFMSCLVEREAVDRTRVIREERAFRYLNLDTFQDHGPSYTDVFLATANVSCVIRLRTSRQRDVFADPVERALTALAHDS